MSKFDESFSEPLYFCHGCTLISGKMSKEEAARAFSHYLGEDICIDYIKADRVRYGFPPEYVEWDGGKCRSCWYTGASGKGSQPVWYIEQFEEVKSNE